MYQINVTVRSGGTHQYRFDAHKNANAIEDRICEALESPSGTVSLKDDYGTTATFLATEITGVSLIDLDQSFKAEEELNICVRRSQMRAESRARHDGEIRQMTIAAQNEQNEEQRKMAALAGRVVMAQKGIVGVA